MLNARFGSACDLASRRNPVGCPIQHRTSPSVSALWQLAPVAVSLELLLVVQPEAPKNRATDPAID
jgi:hypothetical protein